MHQSDEEIKTLEAQWESEFFAAIGLNPSDNFSFASSSRDLNLSSYSSHASTSQDRLDLSSSLAGIDLDAILQEAQVQARPSLHSSHVRWDASTISNSCESSETHSVSLQTSTEDDTSALVSSGTQYDEGVCVSLSLSFSSNFV